MKSLTDIVYENYAHVDFKPPKGVKTACKRGLELKKDYGGAGLTSAAVSWATKLAKGSPISPEKARKMHAYFARHEVDRKKDWDDPPTPGYVAWMLWGGNSGRSWSAKIVKQLDAADKRRPRSDEAKKTPKYKKKGLVGPGGAWKTAKRQAKKQGKGDNDNYVGAIYKKMKHESVSSIVKTLLAEDDDKTSSGKPIPDRESYKHIKPTTSDPDKNRYNPSNPSYKVRRKKAESDATRVGHHDWSKQDHLDASNHHDKKYYDASQKAKAAKASGDSEQHKHWTTIARHHDAISRAHSVRGHGPGKTLAQRMADDPYRDSYE